MHYVDLSAIHACLLHVGAPPLMQALRYSALNVVNTVELRNRILFDFYLGLPHIRYQSSEKHHHKVL